MRVDDSKQEMTPPFAAATTTTTITNDNTQTGTDEQRAVARYGAPMAAFGQPLLWCFSSQKQRASKSSWRLGRKFHEIANLILMIRSNSSHCFEPLCSPGAHFGAA